MPHGTIGVSTPSEPQQPKGPFWDELRAATSREQVIALQERAQRFRYGSGGQLMTAIADKLASFDKVEG